jgi:hypothetical protein
VAEMTGTQSLASSAASQKGPKRSNHCNGLGSEFSILRTIFCQSGWLECLIQSIHVVFIPLAMSPPCSLLCLFVVSPPSPSHLVNVRLDSECLPDGVHQPHPVKNEISQRLESFCYAAFWEIC